MSSRLGLLHASMYLSIFVLVECSLISFVQLLIPCMLERTCLAPDAPTLAVFGTMPIHWVISMAGRRKMCCVCRYARAFHVAEAGLDLAEHGSLHCDAQRQRAAPAGIAQPNRGYSHAIIHEIVCMNAFVSPRIQALLRASHNPPETVRGSRQRQIGCSLFFIVWI